MEALFTIENLITLVMLVLLQAVLGFDNLLYITLESKRVEPSKQAQLRRNGIFMAVALRIILLFVVMKMINSIKFSLFKIDALGIYGDFSFHAVIVLFGGIFIIYTAIKEIIHMLVVHEIGADNRNKSTYTQALISISIMTTVFSFDSILSAIALTDVFPVMAAAIIIGGVLMVVLADEIAVFLQKNRMYEVLGLFILLIVGILLLSEGGHLAHLSFFGYAITPMSKATFYFVIAVIVLVDIVQSRYAKKLLVENGQSSAN